jgi:hypothetical protein
VVAREHPGGGRTIYIPWNIGAIFWEVLAADHGRLIENAVRWALGKTPDVTVTGHSVLDLSVRASADGTAVLLNNIANPMMMKGPIRAAFPVGRHEVSVAIPTGRRLARAELLVAGEAPRAFEAGGRVTIEVPAIETLEVVYLAWA